MKLDKIQRQLYMLSGTCVLNNNEWISKHGAVLLSCEDQSVTVQSQLRKFVVNTGSGPYRQLTVSSKDPDHI
jgi:hypothetical protein